MATANVNTVPTKADRTKVVFPRKHLVPGERIALGREAVHACLFRTSVDHPFSGRGRYRAALRDGSTGQGSDRIYPSSDDRSALPVPSGHPSSLGVLKEVSDCSYWHYCSYPIILVLERYPSIWRFCPCWSPLSLS